MNAAAILDRLPDLRIVVWGDCVADEFIEGDIARVSREAPVLILKRRARRLVAGGGGNAAVNLAALGVRVRLVGVVGEDEAGEALLAYFAEHGVEVGDVLRLRGRPTPTKTRILAGHAHTARQQVIRVDREPDGAPAAGVQARLQRLAVARARHSHGLLIADYGYGAAPPALVRAARRQLGRKALLTLDSRYGVAQYRGLTAATPNEGELEEIFHVRIGSNGAALESAARALLGQLRCRWLLVTRGRDGMALFSRGRPTLHIPIHGSDRAVDVTGAGDTVIAVFTAALAAGADGATAARLANCAAGLVVMKPGTAFVTADELRRSVPA